MKRETTHISKENVIATGHYTCLCGRKQDFNIAWYDKVHNYSRHYKGKVAWCKTCKMVFNGQQSKKKDILK